MPTTDTFNSGSGTWTAPTGVTSATIEMWGSGNAGDSNGGNGGTASPKLTFDLSLAAGESLDYVVAPTGNGFSSTLVRSSSPSIGVYVSAGDWGDDGIGGLTNWQESLGGETAGQGDSGAGGGGAGAGGALGLGFPGNNAVGGSPGTGGGGGDPDGGAGGDGGATGLAGSPGQQPGGGGGGGGTGAAGGDGGAGRIRITYTTAAVTITGAITAHIGFEMSIVES